MTDARTRFDRFVRWTIEVEHGGLPSELPAGEREAFEDYYKKLPKPGDEPEIRRYLRGFWRSEAGYAARWIAAHPGARVLDAGSGFGTYAMLYAAMGGRVEGVDLRPDRLDAAERRLRFWQRTNDQPLDVRYRRGDLTREWPEDVDLVWVYNALSHIDPLDDFLGAVRRHLRPGGVLVVGDINGGHPAHLARLAEVRSEVHQEYVAPDGARHTYAVERTFTPREMREVMTKNGLQVVHHELFWGGLGALPEPLYRGLLQPIQTQWQLGTRSARRQLMVAGNGGNGR